jgi:hypothetical protein
VSSEHISGTFHVILLLKTWEGEISIEWKNKRNGKENGRDEKDEGRKKT